jgi:hypothetical protein
VAQIYFETSLKLITQLNVGHETSGSVDFRDIGASCYAFANYFLFVQSGDIMICRAISWYVGRYHAILWSVGRYHDLSGDIMICRAISWSDMSAKINSMCPKFHKITCGDQGKNWSSEFPCVLYEATEWGPVRIRVRLDPPHPLQWMGQSFVWDRKNWGPVLQWIWHDKDPSLLKSPERRA